MKKNATIRARGITLAIVLSVIGVVVSVLSFGLSVYRIRYDTTSPDAGKTMQFLFQPYAADRMRNGPAFRGNHEIRLVTGIGGQELQIYPSVQGDHVVQIHDRPVQCIFRKEREISGTV